VRESNNHAQRQTGMFTFFNQPLTVRKTESKRTSAEMRLISNAPPMRQLTLTPENYVNAIAMTGV
jgi:hypothetical protein